jgi:hypothetical protein
MPEDKKPKPSVVKKEKPKASTLRSIIKDFLSSAGGTMAKGAENMSSPGIAKATSQFALDRMSKKITPYGYTTGEGSSLVRGAKVVGLNKMEKNRANIEKAIKENKPKVLVGENVVDTDAAKVRLDLLNLLSNKEQRFKNIIPSEFTPLDYKKGTKYVKSNKIDELVLSNLGIKGDKISGINDLQQALDNITATRPSGRKPTEEELKISPYYTPQEKVTGKYGNLVGDPVMGDATYNVGEDDKGYFISYRDTWDLNPTEGGTSEEEVLASPYSVEGLLQKAKGLGKEAASGLLKVSSSAPEIYGRIYFDKKTGKRVK